MSTERGNGSRTRAQKYKNRTAFKNDLHDKTEKQKRCNAMHVSEVCQHCKGVIEWKIKYKKYKPLTQPKTCTRCQLKKVVKAYHVLCRECARQEHVCAKCLKSADEVEIEPPQPTPEEELKLKVEMDRLIKSLPERKRRAFQRCMDKGKKIERAEGEESSEEEDAEAEDVDGERKKSKYIPYTREELLKKIEQMTAAGDNEGSDLSSEEDNSDSE